MPIQTDLSVAPYYDDFNETKNYHRILFKPGVAVQTREVNQLQTILQNQIERFGDNIYTKGTIIDGCNFQYNAAYPYVKIRDLQVDGEPVVIGAYESLFAVSSSNLVSVIINANSGYEAQAPNLNTLFLKYLNSGANNNQTSYNNDDVLTIYNSQRELFQVNVPVGGTGTNYTNTDVVVFVSALQLPANTVVAVDDTINDPVSLANGIVVAVNNTIMANSLVVSVRPQSNSLTSNAITSTSWIFNSGNTVLVNNTTPTVIQSLVGSGAAAIILTNGSGVITQVVLKSTGSGYIVPPQVSVKHTGPGIVNVSSTSITAQNYLAQVTVANSALSGASPAVGTGYAFGVSEGVIFQKGYFLYVSPQTIIVDQYSSTPDGVYVGFNTAEAIINSSIDPTLLDNSTGTFNTQAPGADRLQLTPYLITLNEADAVGNTDFFAITAFSLGQPFLQNQQTSYSVIGSEMAQRTYDSSGDFVVDPFDLTTQSPPHANDEPYYFETTIDPGEAYISGYRVKTETNFSLQVRQGTDTRIAKNTKVNLNYDNSIEINEVGGVFDFTINDLVTLYDAPKTFLSYTGNSSVNSYFSTSNTTPIGNAIGIARIRNLDYASGVAGRRNGTYKAYIYDINMNPAQSFRDARSLYYTSNSYAGIADLVLTYDPSSNSNVAVIANTTGGMVFPHGANSTQTSNNISFTYRDIRNLTTGGVVQVALSGSQFFPYEFGTQLSNAQLQEVSVIFAANATATNVSDTFVINTTSGILKGNTVTGDFNSRYTAGDYIKIFQAVGSDIRRIDAVINSTAIQLSSNGSAANTHANAAIYYPMNVPINLYNRSDISANLDNSGQVLSINLGQTLINGTSNVNVVFNAKEANGIPTSKIANRNTTVILNANTNTGSEIGPWGLGHTDIFRLRNVYIDQTNNVINQSNSTTTIYFNNTSVTGAYSNGETVTQFTGVYALGVSGINGTFNIGDVVQQSNSSMTIIENAYVQGVNSTVFIVGSSTQNPSGAFSTSFTLVKTGATTTNATVTSVTALTPNVGQIINVSNVYPAVLPSGLTANVFSITIANTTGNVYSQANIVGVGSGAYGTVAFSDTPYVVTANAIPNTAIDVTNEFYIDHGQNVNRYDYGLLYKKSGSHLSINGNNALIVSFDHFSNASAGFFTKASYPVDDTQSFANLTSVLIGGSINTLEIPEFTTAGGTTYDLIDCVDFRPKVITTAAATAGNLAISTIDPVILPAELKYQTANIHVRFPTPGTAYASDITQYMGRIDRIVIDNNSVIKSIEGTPKANGAVPPSAVGNTLTINLLNIPPYPSLPAVFSNNYATILDTKIINEGVNEQRVILHTVGVPALSNTQLQTYQPVRYTMSDIANLERRVQALEYYVALSQLEQSVTNLAIPSSINPGINRFMHGFFADSFQNTAFTDVTNPENTTVISKNNEVVPGQYIKNIEFDFNANDVNTANSTAGNYLMLPYKYANGMISEFTIVNQPSVTIAGAQVITVQTGWQGALSSSPKTFSLETKLNSAKDISSVNKIQNVIPNFNTVGIIVGTATQGVITGYVTTYNKVYIGTNSFLQSILDSLGYLSVPTKTAIWGSAASPAWDGVVYWTVPAGVRKIKARMWGAGGGAGGYCNKDGGAGGGSGGSGGYIECIVNVTPGQVLQLCAGGGGYGGYSGDPGKASSGASGSGIIPGFFAPGTSAYTGQNTGGGGGGGASTLYVAGNLVAYAGGGNGGGGGNMHVSKGGDGGTGGGGSGYASQLYGGAGGHTYFNNPWGSVVYSTNGTLGMSDYGLGPPVWNQTQANTPVPYGTNIPEYLKWVGYGGGSASGPNGASIGWPGLHGRIVIYI